MENWEKGTNARYAHAREEHLIPLHVCEETQNEGKGKGERNEWKGSNKNGG